MVSHALTLLLALAAADDKGPLGVNVTTAVASERIALEPLRGPIDIVADPYAGRIELRPKKPQPQLLAQIAHHAGAICPTVKAIGSAIELTCRTHRFEAVLTTEGKKQFLDIQELRGLPWREGLAGPPFYHYEPVRAGHRWAVPGNQRGLARRMCAAGGQAVRGGDAVSLDAGGRRLPNRGVAPRRSGAGHRRSGDGDWLVPPRRDRRDLRPPGARAHLRAGRRLPEPRATPSGASSIRTEWSIRCARR